jgi:hypothetical protein
MKCQHCTIRQATCGRGLCRPAAGVVPVALGWGGRRVARAFQRHTCGDDGAAWPDDGDRD